MKLFSNLESKVNNLVDDLDYKRIVNDSDDGFSNEAYIKDLDIPIIGGILYVYHSYKQASKFMRNHTLKMSMRRQVVNVIKEEEKISRSIRRQLNEFLDSKDVSVIEVPDKHMSKFKNVMEDYTDTITWSSRADGKIVLVKRNNV